MKIKNWCEAKNKHKYDFDNFVVTAISYDDYEKPKIVYGKTINFGPVIASMKRQEVFMIESVPCFISYVDINGRMELIPFSRKELLEE